MLLKIKYRLRLTSPTSSTFSFTRRLMLSSTVSFLDYYRKNISFRFQFARVRLRDKVAKCVLVSLYVFKQWLNCSQTFAIFKRKIRKDARTTETGKLLKRLVNKNRNISKEKFAIIRKKKSLSRLHSNI